MKALVTTTGRSWKVPTNVCMWSWCNSSKGEAATVWWLSSYMTSLRVIWQFNGETSKCCVVPQEGGVPVPPNIHVCGHGHPHARCLVFAGQQILPHSLDDVVGIRSSPWILGLLTGVTPVTAPSWDR